MPRRSYLPSARAVKRHREPIERSKSHDPERRRADGRASSRPRGCRGLQGRRHTVPVRHPRRWQLHRPDRGVPGRGHLVRADPARDHRGAHGRRVRRAHRLVRRQHLDHGARRGQSHRRRRVRLPGAAPPAVHHRVLRRRDGPADGHAEDRPSLDVRLDLQGVGHRRLERRPRADSRRYPNSLGRAARAGTRRFPIGGLPYPGHRRAGRPRRRRRGPGGRGRRRRPRREADTHRRPGRPAPGRSGQAAGAGGEAAGRGHGHLQGAGRHSGGAPAVRRRDVRRVPRRHAGGRHDVARRPRAGRRAGPRRAAVALALRARDRRRRRDAGPRGRARGRVRRRPPRDRCPSSWAA